MRPLGRRVRSSYVGHPASASSPAFIPVELGNKPSFQHPSSSADEETTTPVQAVFISIVKEHIYPLIHYQPDQWFLSKALHLFHPSDTTPNIDTVIASHRIASHSVMSTSAGPSVSRSASRRLIKELDTWSTEQKDETGIERLGPVSEDNLMEWEAVINGRGIGHGYDG